jgi:hypothetical protein
VGLRETLLRLAHKFAALPETLREQYADANSRWRCAVCFIIGQHNRGDFNHIPTAALDGLMERCVGLVRWISLLYYNDLHVGDHEREAG